MLSDFPPWQVFRWTYNSETNVIERWNAEEERWVRHDNDLLRGAFVDQQDAALTAIPILTDAEAADATANGWQSEKLMKKISKNPGSY